jgi:excinuclease ABC subunit B
LLDPQIIVKPTNGQIPDLLRECEARIKNGDRVLVTALTKRMCEDLATYLSEKGLRVRYLHSDIETLERVEILVDLRLGNFDVLVGVNLLREGLDLPEVSLVAILDADKEGFLRSPTSLIQLMGRAARNVLGTVVMYADKVTPAMKAAMDETERRRAKQVAYNEANGIIPQTIKKSVRRGLAHELQARKNAREAMVANEPSVAIAELVTSLELEMLEAARDMHFERAAHLRDAVTKLKQRIASAPANADIKVRRSEVDAKPGGKSRSKSDKAAPGTPGTRAGKRRKKS